MYRLSNERFYIMILNNTPQQEAVLSNVGQIGEFRIRNSAKAFSILSSGLYANKVRAIIRELSCNAVDSHVAAGKSDVPFELHLPTALEPWFAVRDFGTGLNHEQVTQIYTTYFESTKTDSNAFIGALGLGSKSPFSYTDNFTVTATQNGVKRIYSAFINGDGVPSIVKMGEETTEDLNGVEVKFSVNERYDFDKFVKESHSVFRHFKLLPVFTGASVTITQLDYESTNIIPGVHYLKNGDGQSSTAVMGNIAYPINIPSADTSLGEYRKLLECGLVMHFEIGELDFQASREGLSYIPSTVESIKKKLVALNAQLVVHLAKELDAIESPWERSIALYAKRSTRLYSEAAQTYALNTQFPLYDVTASRYTSHFSIDMTVEELATMNIVVSSFNIARHTKTCSTNTQDSRRQDMGSTPPNFVFESYWKFPVVDNAYFVLNDTKTGVTERAKHHWRNKESRSYSECVFTLSKIDKTKEMNTEEFMKRIYGGLKSNILKGSSLSVKEREKGVGFGKNVTIVQMEKRGGRRNNSHEYIWHPAGKLSDFDDKKTYYYIPLSGFEPQFKAFGWSAHHLVETMHRTRLDEFQIDVYGVRKGDFKAIEQCANWVNVETYIKDTLNTLTSKVFMTTVKENIDNDRIFQYNIESIIEKLSNDASPAKVLLKEFVGLPKSSGYGSINSLWNSFMKDHPVQVTDLISKYNTEFKKFSKRYPLIGQLCVNPDLSLVTEYIEQIDTMKGI